ncbi:hypothetical protein ACJJTC_015167 [Scirpophaga incertulas]
MADFDMKSLMTLSSKSEASTAPPRLRWRNAALHERCSMPDMLRLKDAFQNAYRNKMLPNEFRQLLSNLLNVDYDDDEFNILFMKINTNRDGAIDWDELVSHLLLGYFANDPDNQLVSLQPPITGLPTIIRSHHRHPISKICFCPNVEKDRSVDLMQGTYITASRDGMMNWWSLDMTLQRTAMSSSPNLKVRTTWVTDMVCMPDMNIIVTSSTERELRFYDCAAKTFTLKIIIASWEYMICTMYYHFDKDSPESTLICGDAGGWVRVLQLPAADRGLFRGRTVLQLRHRDLQRKTHMAVGLKLREWHTHANWVRQVALYASLHRIVSCAGGEALGALFMRDLHSSDADVTAFDIDKGVECFVLSESSHIVVTGGGDGAVRLWSTFAAAATRGTLLGSHRAAVAALALPNPHTACSLGRDRVIKVWDLRAHTCLQTYVDIPAEVGEHTPLSVIYNPATRELVLAGVKIATLVLDEQLNPHHTDGFTHLRAVSQVLYNPLFKVLITCGMGSIIINWDPVSGKRNLMIREAHTRPLYGELLPVEITAACFDSAYHRLLTGARDGSLKVWNFNTGVCLREFSIERMCEVTNCFWVDGRILAVGWNRHVTEWADSGATGGASRGKSWDTRHSDDVVAAAAHAPLALATASYNSELVLWKLETGQPYRRFSCTDPTLRIKLQYNRREPRTTSPSVASTSLHRSPLKRPSAGRRRGGVGTSDDQFRPLAVHSMIFLESRPCDMNVASLIISLENGQIQGWSEHPAGGLRGSFQVVNEDYVAALTTDRHNHMLFAATARGYVTVWLMTNYLTNIKEHVSMPKLRLEFPFLWKDRIEGRAKRRVRDQPVPLLLNSYRAHLRCITTAAYVDDLKLLFTGSSDYSVRVWRLSGEYIGTLGGLVSLTPESPRFPPDVLKVASSTTLKVWRGGEVSRFVPGQPVVDLLRDITEEEINSRTYGYPAPTPLLGRYFRLPARPDVQTLPSLDDSLPTIPVYAHLRLASTQPVRRPPTPELVRATRLRAPPQPLRKAHFARR